MEKKSERTVSGGSRRDLPKAWEGKCFGDLVVVSYAGKSKGKHYWNCRCICGRETVVCQSNLKSGHTRSCGHRVAPASTRHFVEGTCLESIRSRKISANNTSGIRGVYRDKRTQRWVAQITFQGKTRYLGSFQKIEEAARARAEAEKIFEEFLRKHEGQASENNTKQDLCE